MGVFSRGYSGGSPQRTVRHTHGRRMVYLFCETIILVVYDNRNVENIEWRVNVAVQYLNFDG